MIIVDDKPQRKTYSFDQLNPGEYFTTEGCSYDRRVRLKVTDDLYVLFLKSGADILTKGNVTNYLLVRLKPTRPGEFTEIFGE